MFEKELEMMIKASKLAQEKILEIYNQGFDVEIKSDVLEIQNAKTAPIRIGNHVFIGARCIIGKGITIGEKSIVAAGSVVTKNIPPKEMWGGNPAKFIKPIED